MKTVPVVNNRRWTLALALAVALCAVALATLRPASANSGRTIYASPNGGGSGSASAPYGNLFNAVEALQPGDTLVLRAGTYNQPLLLLGVRGGPNAVTTVRAEGAVTIQTGGSDAVLVSNSSHVVIDGFTLEGSGASDDATGVMIRDQSHDITVLRNEIRNWPAGGISTVRSGSIHIEANIIHGNTQRSPWQTSGISLFEAEGPLGAGFENTIRNNVVYDNITYVPAPWYGDGTTITDGNCIILDSFDRTGYTGETLIENNLCTNNGGRGIHIFRANGATVINNTVWNNQRTGDITDGEITSIDSWGNTFRNNLVKPRAGKPAIGIWEPGAIVEGNLLVDAGDNAGVNSWNQASAASAMNAPNDYPFSGDFRPYWGSAAMDRGVSTGAPSTDLLGVARGDRPSIGAFEPDSLPLTPAAVRALNPGAAATPTTTAAAVASPTPTTVAPSEPATPAQEPAESTQLCQGRVPTIIGTSGHDWIPGTEGDDIILALGGNDIIDGMGGNDVICGGAGNDEIYGSWGNDTLIGGRGRDFIDGGDGSDRIYGGHGSDELLGTTGSDRIRGGRGNDVIQGGAGNDRLWGQAGADDLDGNSGRDKLVGGRGDDECDASVGLERAC